MTFVGPFSKPLFAEHTCAIVLYRRHSPCTVLCICDVPFIASLSVVLCFVSQVWWGVKKEEGNNNTKRGRKMV